MLLLPGTWPEGLSEQISAEAIQASDLVPDDHERMRSAKSDGGPDEALS